MPYCGTTFPRMNTTMADRKIGERNSFRDGDPRSIDLGNRDERGYWCKLFQATEAELEAAVGAVGISAERVKRWLAARLPSA